MKEGLGAYLAYHGDLEALTIPHLVLRGQGQGRPDLRPRCRFSGAMVDPFPGFQSLGKAKMASKPLDSARRRVRNLPGAVCVMRVAT